MKKNEGGLGAEKKNCSSAMVKLHGRWSMIIHPTMGILAMVEPIPVNGLMIILLYG